MARILVCADGFFRAFSPVGLEPLVHGFIQSLIKGGHTVIPYIHRDTASMNSVQKYFKARSFVSKVKSFAPDVIFTFNNCILEGFLKVTDCPVYIIASDTPVYWSNHDLIKNYNGRYKLLYFNDDLRAQVRDTYNISYSNQLQIPYVTDVLSCHGVEPKYDISFIGNFYNHSPLIYNRIISRLVKRGDLDICNEFFSIVNDINAFAHAQNDLSLRWKKMTTEIKSDIDYDLFVREIFAARTSELRQKLLIQISDMDLHIFSWSKNFRIVSNNPTLAMKMHFNPVHTIEDNQKVYNNSRLSLTMPHAQVNTGFSWRVCDIMASNALLISNKSKDVISLFKGIIPIYEDAGNLRDLCQYYLKNEKERLSIVRESQLIIDRNHRYKNLLEVLKNCDAITS